MWNQLQDMERQYTDLEQQLQNPELLKNRDLYSEKVSKFSKLKIPVELYREYKKLKNDLISHGRLEKEDKDIALLVQEEIQSIKKKINKIETELNKILTVKPVSELDEKNIILELRAGAGGEEAGLFCKELFQAYEKYSASKGWRVDPLSLSILPSGGVREVISKVSGKNVYAHFKFERGVHRVQRVPKTESQGRIHTSTVTAAVLPEANQTEVKVKNEDLRIDVCRSSGAGGQHVNTTDSAVRITHLPTKLTVYCQDEKSQHANKEKAFKILYARLFALREEEKRKEASQMRLQQIGTGDRSEKIRTYNFPQSRVTDHRISLSVHSLDRVMKGDFDFLIEPLLRAQQKGEI